MPRMKFWQEFRMHKGKYDNVGIIWIDAHPDVSTVNDGYPNAHAMVLGSLIAATP